MSENEPESSTAIEDSGKEGSEAGTSSTKSKVFSAILISAKQHERWMALRRAGDFKTDLTLMDFALKLLEYIQRDKREMVLLPITTAKTGLLPQNHDPCARIFFPSDITRMPISTIELPKSLCAQVVNMQKCHASENSGSRIVLGLPDAARWELARKREGPPKKRIKYSSLDEKSSLGYSAFGQEYLASASGSTSPESFPGRMIRVESLSSTDSEDSINQAKEREGAEGGNIPPAISHTTIPLIKIEPPDSYETYGSPEKEPPEEESGAGGKSVEKEKDAGILQEGGASVKVGIDTGDENVITVSPVEGDCKDDSDQKEAVKGTEEVSSAGQAKRDSESVDERRTGDTKRIKLVHTRGIWFPEVHSPTASPSAIRRSPEFKFPLPRGDSHGEGTQAAGDNGNNVVGESYAQSQSARYSYSCNLCSTCFMSEADVRQHLSGEHNIYRYICRICGISNDDEMTLYEHSQETHPNIFCCGIEGCKYFSVRLSSVKGHFNAEHNQRLMNSPTPTEVLWNEGTNADKYIDQQVAYISTTLENLRREVQSAIATARGNDALAARSVFMSPPAAKRAKSLDTYSKPSFELNPESPVSPKRRRTIICGPSRSSSGEFPEVESGHCMSISRSKDGLESPIMGLSGWTVSSSPRTPLSQASSASAGSDTVEICLDPGPGSSGTSERSDTDSLEILGVEPNEEVSAVELARREQEMERATKMFRKFLTESGESLEFEKLPKSELNNRLKQFISNIRTRAGKYFKASTLRDIYSGMSRHLQKDGIDILVDSDFESSRQVFKTVMADIRSAQFQEPHTPQLSQEDIFKLYSPTHNTFDTSSPVGLQNKVWFELKLHLDRRKTHDFCAMTRDLFTIQKDSNGRDYVGLTGEGRMYDMPGSHLCPVLSFGKYLSKLNPNLSNLWQSPCVDMKVEDSIWYGEPALDQVSLSTKMADISRMAGLSQVYSNHSVRVTSLSLLSRTYHGTPISIESSPTSTKGH